MAGLLSIGQATMFCAAYMEDLGVETNNPYASWLGSFPQPDFKNWVEPICLPDWFALQKVFGLKFVWITMPKTDEIIVTMIFDWNIFSDFSGVN